MFSTLISGAKYSISKGKGAANHHTASCQGNCFAKPDHQTTGSNNFYLWYKIITSPNTVSLGSFGFRDQE